MTPIVITFGELPKLPNQLNRKSYWTFKKEKDHWLDTVRVWALNRRTTPPIEKAVVVYLRHSVRAPDFDGLVGSFKYVQDALVAHGVLKDDDMQTIVERKYLWAKSKSLKTQGIMLAIYPTTDETFLQLGAKLLKERLECL